MVTTLTHLECSRCGKIVDASQLQNLCPACQSPLLARYDLNRARELVTPTGIERRPPGIWRWQELLPVSDPQFQISLGEGETPVIPVPKLGSRLGLDALYIKDEGLNPTGSFKARGMAVAVSRALELGANVLVTPTAGNAGGAMAA